ncbi:MAG: PIN domain-containing protein [Methanocellales archaeon]|nr:PIN domain-containing protein [Methanocellales archaeon]
MSCFVDTSVFVAAYNKKDKHHNSAKRLLRSALKGEYGAIYTSDHIFNEMITLILRRVGNVTIAKEVGDAILRSPRINLTVVDVHTFLDAWTTFNDRDYLFDSFTDYVTYEMVKRFGISTILSHDSYFDAVEIPRIC